MEDADRLFECFKCGISPPRKTTHSYFNSNGGFILQPWYQFGLFCQICGFCSLVFAHSESAAGGRKSKKQKLNQPKSNEDPSTSAAASNGKNQQSATNIHNVISIIHFTISSLITLYLYQYGIPVLYTNYRETQVKQWKPVLSRCLLWFSTRRASKKTSSAIKIIT